MYNFLDEGGQLITYSGISWTFGTQKKCKEFKNWIHEEVCGTCNEMDQGAFIESGTNVKTILIDIYK